MHLRDPIAETVENHAPDDGMVGVKRVPGAAVVGVARAVCHLPNRKREDLDLRGKSTGEGGIRTLGTL